MSSGSREIVTGTIHSALNAVSHASHALDKTMDGINMAMRLMEEDGDVDMFGCEDGIILVARKQRFECEMASFNCVQDNDLATEA